MNSDGSNRQLNAVSAEQRKALTSPLRLEIIGLFTSHGALSIADMAERMGRSPGSLYHHVGILENVGLLRRAGTRPKGKRYEALFEVSARLTAFEADPKDEDSIADLVRAMSAAFRMSERDLEAALRRDDLKSEGPARNLLATRVHMRISPDLLAELNQHIDAIQTLLVGQIDAGDSAGPEDELLSLTLALLPLRRRDSVQGGTLKNQERPNADDRKEER